MYGVTGENMVFPIVSIINKELKNALMNGEFDALISQSNTRGNSSVNNSSSNTSVKVDANILTQLESNDFSMTLLKSDPSKPNMLTGVLIKFTETLSEIISLIRESTGKLQAVKMNVVQTQPTSSVINNPFNMSGADYIAYVMGKRRWNYYNAIANDPTQTQLNIDHAKALCSQINLANIELRSIYGVAPSQDYTYAALVKYLPNPLAMDAYDYTEYMINKRISTREYPGISDADVAQAALNNQELRRKYFLVEDIFTYLELKPYLDKPTGMHEEDFAQYVANKKAYEELVGKNADIDLEIININLFIAILDDEDDSDQIANLRDDADALLIEKGQNTATMASLAASNAVIRAKYYALAAGVTTGFQDTYAYLAQFLVTKSDATSDKVLFSIIISLSYDDKGHLSDVKSETVVV